MERFEIWYNKCMNESDETSTIERPIASTDISTDVDTIINSLETLANELKEELKIAELGAIHEANPTDFIKSWITSIMAVSAQKKVNKIRLNATDIEIASKKAEGEAKSNLEDKADMAKDQASELQSMVDDKFKGKGDIVDKKLAQAKIAGQLEIIKRNTGMEDDPAVKADLKAKLKELADKYREESEAIKEIENENKDAIEAEKERIRQERENDKSETRDEAETSDDTSKTTDDLETEKEPVDPTAEKEAAIAQYDTNIKDEVARKNSLQTKLKDATDELETTTDKENMQAKIAKIKMEIENSDEDIKQMKAEKAKLVKELSKEPSAKESLVIRANSIGNVELAEEIAGKLDWQFENHSMLYVKYNAMISKIEHDNILNESRYTTLDIKSKFNTLL